MPVIVAGYADTGAIDPGAVYSNESISAQASDEVLMSQSAYTDIPGLTINLTLAQPAGVVQIAQVDFKGTAFKDFGIQVVGDGVAHAVSRAPRYSGVWQHLLAVWYWPSLVAGNHIFKVQCTAGTIKNRKNIILVMRI